MAEIFCDVASKAAEAVSPAATTTSEVISCKENSRAARRLRMQIIRKFRSVQPTDGMVTTQASAEAGEKRRRLDCSLVVPSPSEIPIEEEAMRSLGREADRTLGKSRSEEPGASSGQVGGVVTRGSINWPAKYGMMSVRGRRRDMEDTVSIRPDFLRRNPRLTAKYHFFSVYDGHGCSHVATACRNQMHEMVAEEISALQAGPSLPLESWWRSVMQNSFRHMDAAVDELYIGERSNPGCKCELLTLRCNHVGSTAVVAVVEPRQIVIANCGDSRAVLCRNGVAIPLSSDHKPDRPDELSRIEAAGGRVIYWDGARVFGVLAMSRAIGDSYLRPFVIPDPEVTVTERTDEDECLILASDGLWDVVSNEMACNIARMCLRSADKLEKEGQPARGEEGGDDEDGSAPDLACSKAAKLLTQLAIARQSADNVSVVVVDLRKRRL